MGDSALLLRKQRTVFIQFTVMKKLLVIISLAIAAAVGLPAASWQPDILGSGYEMRYVDQGRDYSGDVRSTIIRKKSDCRGHKGVLYIHGYNDYFFQKDMADRFADSCINFYAVDLRKYGRSITEGQRLFQVRDLKEYFADIDSALAQMHADGIDTIALMGHSTGGLISAYYLSENPDSPVKALLLNSPFLDWNFNGFMRKVAIPAFGALGRLFPDLAISQGDGTGYQESLLKKHHGEWNYNQDWKLFHPQKVDASWTRAISSAQNKIKKGAGIKVPILLMHSDKSVDGDHWTPEFQHADAVLNVKDISRIGRKLGQDVTEDTIRGGLHDLVLSSPPVREQVYYYIFSWLRQKHIF